MGWIWEILTGVAGVVGTLIVIGLFVWFAWKHRTQRTLLGRLLAHFAPSVASQITVKQRFFPEHIRVDS